jgi:hypothetical protein
LGTVSSDAHPLDGIRLAITHEDVPEAIGITWDEIAGPGVERYIASASQVLVQIAIV